MKPFIPELEFSLTAMFYLKDKGTDTITVEKKAPVTLHYGTPTLFV